MAMKWRPAPADLIERFTALAQRNARLELRKMFGYPCAFLNGNMLMGLFQEQMALRLPPESRTEFLKLDGATPFEPMGRPMREYVSVPPAWLGDLTAVQPWVAEAIAFVSALPAKKAAAKNTAKKSAAKKSAASRPATKQAAPKKTISKPPAQKPARASAATKPGGAGSRRRSVVAGKRLRASR